MKLADHELKALAIELAAAMPPSAKREREHAPIDMLFNEMDAVIVCLQEKMLSEDKRDFKIAYALAMALERLNNELGRTAGVIE